MRELKKIQKRMGSYAAGALLLKMFNDNVQKHFTVYLIRLLNNDLSVATICTPSQLPKQSNKSFESCQG